MQKQDREQLRFEVLAELDRREWSMTDLASKVGKTTAALRALFAHQSNSIRLALDICEALNLPIRLAYKCCNLPIPEPEGDRGK